MQGKKKVILMATAASDEEYVMDGLTAHYRNLNRYMKWESIGMILARGCAVREAIERTEFPRQAYELGKSIID
jgi:hypothetical protein